MPERTRLSALLEQAPDGIFIANFDCQYTDVNEAGCRLLGASREQIVGTYIKDWIPQEDMARLAAASEELRAGGVQVAKWRLKRCDGTYVPVEVSAKLLPDGRWQGLVRDITERERALERLESAHRELQDAHAEITRLYAQLTEQEAVKSRFFADAGDDLRTPLALIGGVVEKLLDTAGEATQKPLAVIARNVRILRHNVDELLAVSKLETGQIKPTAGPGAGLPSSGPIDAETKPPIVREVGGSLGAARAKSGSPPVLGPAHAPLVVVAEEHSAMSRLLGDLLCADYRVMIASDGEEALGLVQEYEPDLLITDIVMPRLGGERLVDELRAVPRFENMPIMVVTARQDLGSCAHHLRRGASDCLIRPFSTEELLARVANLVERRLADARFRGLFEAAADGLLVVDHRGLMLRVNSQAEHMFGWSRDDLVGQPVEKLVPVEARAGHDRLMARFLAAPMTRSMGAGRHLRAVRKDGTEFPSDIGLGVLHEGGAPLVIVSVRDVTDREQAADERERLVAQLQASLEEVKQLSGLLPICSWCKNIRDEKGYWHEVSDYIASRSDARFTHGICAGCMAKVAATGGVEQVEE